MTVNLIDNGEQWDRFIGDSPYSTLFHRWKFLKIVEKHSGYRLLPFGVYKGSELTCVFPAFYRSIAGVRMVFSPPPRSVIPNLGPVMSADYGGLKQNKRENHLNGAIDELNAEIAKLAPRYTFISAVPGLDDARPFQWSGYDVRICYTYVLDLRPPLDQIWGGFSQGCRKNIKACGKHPITIERTTDVETFNHIMLDRLGSKGLSSPTHGTAYLRELLEAFPDNLKMYFVRSGGEIGSLALHCEHKGRLMFWVGDINVRKDLPYNEYAMWEFVKDAKARGICELELEGAVLRELNQYKSKYNPTLQPFYHIYKKGVVGSAAEWAFKNVVARKWVPTRGKAAPRALAKGKSPAVAKADQSSP